MSESVNRTVENPESPESPETPETPERHRAGLFDIRSIIGLLIGIYGVILVITGFFTSDDQIAKSDGVNLNLWAGLVMVVVGVAFLLWARLRPIVVPEDPSTAGGERPPTH